MNNDFFFLANFVFFFFHAKILEFFFPWCKFRIILLNFGNFCHNLDITISQSLKRKNPDYLQPLKFEGIDLIQRI
jgi:hypothetical protein